MSAVQPPLPIFSRQHTSSAENLVRWLSVEREKVYGGVLCFTELLLLFVYIGNYDPFQGDMSPGRPLSLYALFNRQLPPVSVEDCAAAAAATAAAAPPRLNFIFFFCQCVVRGGCPFAETHKNLHLFLLLYLVSLCQTNSIFFFFFFPHSCPSTHLSVTQALYEQPIGSSAMWSLSGCEEWFRESLLPRVDTSLRD